MERSAELEQVIVGDEYALAVYGPVLLQVWEHATPEEGARRAVSMARSLGQSGYARVGTISLIGEDSVFPPAESRRIFSEFPKAIASDAGCALVREGQGFRSAGVRAVLTSIAVLSGGGYPYEVFGDVPSAAHWLCHRLRHSVDVDELTAAMQRLRSQVARVTAPL